MQSKPKSTGDIQLGNVTSHPNLPQLHTPSSRLSTFQAVQADKTTSKRHQKMTANLEDGGYIDDLTCERNSCT